MTVYNVLVINEAKIEKGELNSELFSELETAQRVFEDWWNHLVGRDNIIEERMEDFDKGRAYVRVDNNGEIFQLHLLEQRVL